MVTSSPNFKKKVALRVSTLDLYKDGPIPGFWTNLRNLTLEPSCPVKLVFDSENSSSLKLVLSNLTTLEITNKSYFKYLRYYKVHKEYNSGSDDDDESSDDEGDDNFLDKILSLSSNLKSLSIPYAFLLNPNSFSHVQNLEELVFTTSYHNNVKNYTKNANFEQNLKNLATICINLKSYTCQELTKSGDKYAIEYIEEGDVKFFHGILAIIENNSHRLEKLEFGISTLLLDPTFSSKLAKISLPKLKFLNLRAVTPKDLPTNDGNNRPIELRVLDILHNLPQPGQLTTLKLTLTSCPLELFELISQKFSQIKSLSLKASRYALPPRGLKRELDETRWSFLQSLTQLKELEITRFILHDQSSDFGLEILDKFPDFLVNCDLQKFSLKVSANDDDNDFACSRSSKFFKGISKMSKLKELTLTGDCLSLGDFMNICTNLKFLEKSEISHLHADSNFHHKSPRYCTMNYNKKAEDQIDPRQIITAFSSLIYLKELSIDFWDGDFREVLGSSMSFPYLKSLTLCNAKYKLDEKAQSQTKIGSHQVENIIGLNCNLKELNILFPREYEYYQPFENIDFPDETYRFPVQERRNLKVDFSTKLYVKSSSRQGEARDDCDPDSRPINEQNANWPFWEYENFNTDWDY